MSKERDFELGVLIKRTEEGLSKIHTLEQEVSLLKKENQRMTEALEDIYESGDYSRNTETLIRLALGLEDLWIKK